MGLIVERVYPWILALLGGISYLVYALCHPDLLLSNDLKAFLSMVNDVFATLVGFLMTTMSLIWSIQDRSAIRLQKESQTYPYFIGYMFVAAFACLLCVVVNIVISSCMTANIYLHGQPRHLAATAWVSVHIFAIASCFRVIRTLSAVLKSDTVAG